MKIKNGLFLGIMSYCLCISTFAADLSSPVGKWVTIDSKTHKPTGIVEITNHDEGLSGKIIEGFGVDPIKICTHCPGNLKNTPVIGLTFLWGFLPQGKNTWKNGHILNPHDGKIYRGAIMLVDNGKKLQLRGYWGIFFQTETWLRDDIS
jgi:uncharacterized protein (DUF2147 family)